MGNVTDIEELLPQALREAKHKKLARVVWALATSIGTIVVTTATVTWQVNEYLHKASEQHRELSGKVLVLDKHVELLEERCDKAKTLAEAASVQADKALLYAQLTGQRGGVK
jgi:hypothetical protein